MLTVSTAQENVLNGYARSSHLKVSVYQGSTWYELNNLESLNWIKTVSWSDDIDNTVMEAIVSCHLNNDYFSLSPLSENSKINNYTGSFDPLINITVPIKIEAIVLGEGQDPASADWKNVFEGTIEDISFNKDLRLRCADKGAALMRTTIESEVVYGSVGGTAVETAMQSILTDNSTGVTLWVPVSPSWSIHKYIQRKEPVLQALQNLAKQIGWIVRYRWDSGTSAWRLKLYEPDRTASSVDFTFSPSDYISINNLGLDAKNIRNVVRVVYSDFADEYIRKTYEANNAASIAAYGRRYCEIAEASTSNIDHLTEATALADAVLADLKDPVLNQTVTMPFFWPVETGDLYKFEANNKNYDSDQTIAVKGWTHTFDSGGKVKTQIMANGKPAGGYKLWLDIEARRGVAPTADEKGTIKPQERSNYTTNSGMGAFNISSESSYIALLPNNDFGDQSRDVTDFEPDAWAIDTSSSYGAWGSSSDVYVSTSVTQSGGQSVHFRNTATADVRMVSDFFPVVEGNLYFGSAIAQGDSVDGSDQFDIDVTWYQNDKSTVVSASSVFSGRFTGSAWTDVILSHFVAPANSRYAVVNLKKTTSTAHNVYLDIVMFGSGLPYGNATVSTSVATGTLTQLLISAVSTDDVSGFSLPNDDYTFYRPGVYFIGSNVFLTDTNLDGNYLSTVIDIYDLGTTTWNQKSIDYKYASTNALAVLSGSVGLVVRADKGDKVRVRVEQDSGGNQTVTGYLEIQQITGF